MRPSCWPSSPVKTQKQGDDGVFRIVHKVAKDRVISTVDPEARHGHKSRNRRFDGYKAHLSVDPDSELIDEVAVTPANTPDRDAVDDLLEGLADEEDKPEIVGDSAYADGATRASLSEAGFEVVAKVPPVRNATGLFTKDRFVVDLDDPERDLSGRPARRHQPHPRRWRTGLVQGPLQGLPAAPSVHQVTRRAHHHDRPPRGPAPNGPGRAGGPRSGRRAIGPTGPRSSARSPTSSAALGVDATHGCAARRRIATDVDTRAGAINWLDWPSSDWPTTVLDGAWRAVGGPTGVSPAPSGASFLALSCREVVSPVDPHI